MVYWWTYVWRKSLDYGERFHPQWISRVGGKSTSWRELGRGGSAKSIAFLVYCSRWGQKHFKASGLELILKKIIPGQNENGRCVVKVRPVSRRNLSGLHTILWQRCRQLIFTELTGGHRGLIETYYQSTRIKIWQYILLIYMNYVPTVWQASTSL